MQNQNRVSFGIPFRVEQKLTGYQYSLNNVARVPCGYHGVLLDISNVILW